MGETIKLWKDMAEKEESKKLELKIARELDLQRSETIETRATELMENFNNLKFAQEAEINILEKKHKEAMATETKLREEAGKTIKKQDAEIKKQRSFYGEKMKLV